MGRVRILSDTLCNQIAAGEVVERPAAVVKELVENSLDAGAGSILVSLLDGGRREIRVVDDGSGMARDDALLAVERHATSKIASVSDLHAIRTLGFRGEALPSIAAVSRFELLTREGEAPAGTLVFMEGGVLRECREAGAPPGTSVTVRDLFFNVPARRKFLRSAETEAARAAEDLLRLAAAHPGVRFRLLREGRVVFDLPRTGDPAQRGAKVLGVEPAEALEPVAHDAAGVHLAGLAGPPEVQRPTARSVLFYVNGRYVQDRGLLRAALSAYETLLPRGKYPALALFLDIPPDLVDVNVHPAKREVRFRRPADIAGAVRRAVAGALAASNARRYSRPLVPGGGGKAPGAAEAQGGFTAPFWPGAAPPRPGFAPQIGAPPPASGGSAPLFSRLPVIGELAGSYILCEAADGLVIIDQHAAHERVLYNRLENPAGVGQRLLRPIVLEFLPGAAEALSRNLPLLSRLGFEVEPFGGASFAVRAVPAALAGVPPEEVLRDIAETAPEDGPAALPALLSAIAKSAACHAAVRFGQRLRPEEIATLLSDLDETATAATCPHGRPVWWKLTLSEIARLFDRGGAP